MLKDTTDGMYYKEVHWLKDGKLLVYKRPDSRNYYCRVLLNNKGYKKKSCKTSSISEAMRFAEDLYDTYRFKVLNKLPLETKTFGELFEDWFAKAEKSEYRRDFYRGRADLYFMKYFGNYKIEEVDENIIDGYWDWRKNFYKNHPELKKGNASETPSAISLKMEKTAIREVLEYAQMKGYIRTIPKIRYKIVGKAESRDEFTKHEYDLIYMDFYTWMHEKARADVVYQRRMLFNLIVFLANTGIRPNEYHKIKWKHIKLHNEEGVDTLHIDIISDNKTGKRTLVSKPEAYSVYCDIKTFSKYQDDNDYFFNNYVDGSPAKNISKTFITRLKKLGLYISDSGKARPLYSLRHFYATQKLLTTNITVYDLAMNMGTSVKQIENHYGHVLAVQKTKALIQGEPVSTIQIAQENAEATTDENILEIRREQQEQSKQIDDLLNKTEKLLNDCNNTTVEQLKYLNEDT